MNNRISFDRENTWGKEEENERANLRFNIITILVYLIGIILIFQLFNLQIVNGETYREQSNTRLSRVNSIESSRGSILDRSGNELASVRTKNTVELYKTNVPDEELNSALLKLVNLLDQYGAIYSDTFPIKINPFEFTIEGDELAKWKTKYKIEDNATAEQAFYKFKDKYSITNENIEEIRKILVMRYTISTTGYSATKSIKISEDVSNEIVAQISERNSEFPGISIKTDTVRTYTHGSLAAHVLGYTGKISEEEYNKNKEIYDSDDIVGKTGIEYLFEKYLKGTDGKKQVDMAVDGTITGEYVSESAIAGNDIVLTIDSNLQQVTEIALENCIKKIREGGFSETYDTQSGSAVVMNVNTGEVLAAASYPTYEPEWFVGGIDTETWNSLRDNTAYPLLNKTIQSSYAPGSVFKMVTAIAGLESGVITTKEKINDTGVYKKYGETWNCWYYTDYHRGHGWINVTQALQRSCNYFFYETGDRLGIDTLAKYALHFGLGRKTGIELPSEKAGSVASKETKAEKNNGESWYPGDTLSAAIGQSYNDFTPMQIAKYISMIANGGKEINPTIIKTILKVDGTEIPREEYENYVKESLGIEDYEDDIQISQESIEVAKQGMRMVTEEVGGTAYSIFKNFNVEVAGKTGSAETGKTVNAWFVCFAPYENPEVAVVVMIEGGAHGNYSAEVVKEILVQYFGMNQTNEVNENTQAIPYTEEIR